MTRTLTPTQVIDAIELNGYEHIRNNYIKSDGSSGLYKIIGACAIGQASLNLGLEFGEIENVLDAVKVEVDGDGPDGLGGLIVRLNDVMGLSLKEIVSIARNALSKSENANVEYPVPNVHNYGTVYSNYQGVKRV